MSRIDSRVTDAAAAARSWTVSAFDSLTDAGGDPGGDPGGGATRLAAEGMLLSFLAQRLGSTGSADELLSWSARLDDCLGRAEDANAQLAQLNAITISVVADLRFLLRRPPERDPVQSFASATRHALAGAGRSGRAGQSLFAALASERTRNAVVSLEPHELLDLTRLRGLSEQFLLLLYCDEAKSESYPAWWRDLIRGFLALSVKAGSVNDASLAARILGQCFPNDRASLREISKVLCQLQHPCGYFGFHKKEEDKDHYDYQQRIISRAALTLSAMWALAECSVPGFRFFDRGSWDGGDR